MSNEVVLLAHVDVQITQSLDLFFSLYCYSLASVVVIDYFLVIHTFHHFYS